MRYILALAFLAALVALAACSSSSARIRPSPIPMHPVWLASEHETPDYESAGVDEPADLDGSFGMAAVIEYAAERNPRLAGARGRWMAARQRPAQASALPDPMLTYMEMLRPIETRIGPVERSVTLTQRIPFPSKLQSAGAIASERARIGEMEYHIALRDIVADVKTSYVELLYLRKAVRIVEQNQGIATQLSQKGAALYGGGDKEGVDPVTLFDTMKAQSQVAQLAYDLITLQELVRTEEARLNGLLSRGPGAKLGTPMDLLHRPLLADRDQLYNLALERNQELKAARSRILAADESLRLAELGRLPDFTIGVQHTFIGTRATAVPGNGDDATGLMLGFTLPLWAQKNQARIAEAEYMRQARRADRQAAVDSLLTKVTRVFFRIQNAERLVLLYGESLVPQAAHAMEIAEQWHDSGRTTFGRLLEARSVWLNFQLAYHRALADYEQMVVRMEQLVGFSLGHLRKEPVR